MNFYLAHTMLYLRNALLYYHNYREEKNGINIDEMITTYKPNLEQQFPAPHPAGPQVP